MLHATRSRDVLLACNTPAYQPAASPSLATYLLPVRQPVINHDSLHTHTVTD